MTTHYIYRTYTISGDASSLDERIAGILLSKGYQVERKEGNSTYFRNPSLTFSSKRPLTCVSRLMVKLEDHDGSVRVNIGVNFAKIRLCTIAMFGLVCFVLPAVVGYVKYGIPEIPPMAYIGIPLGIMVHYHVRWRVFRTLGLLLDQLGTEKKENKGMPEYKKNG